MSVQEYKFKFSADTADLEKVSSYLLHIQQDFKKVDNTTLTAKFDVDTSTGEANFEKLVKKISGEHIRAQIEFIGRSDEVGRKKDVRDFWVAKRAANDTIPGFTEENKNMDSMDIVNNVNKSINTYIGSIEDFLKGSQLDKAVQSYEDLNSYLHMVYSRIKTQKIDNFKISDAVKQRYSALFDSMDEEYQNAFAYATLEKPLKSARPEGLTEFSLMFVKDLEARNNEARKNLLELYQEANKKDIFGDKAGRFFTATGRENAKRGMNTKGFTDAQNDILAAAAEATKLIHTLDSSNMGIFAANSDLSEAEVFDVLIEKAEHYKRIQEELSRLKEQQGTDNSFELNEQIALLERVAQMEKRTFATTAGMYNLGDEDLISHFGGSTPDIMKSSGLGESLQERRKKLTSQVNDAINYLFESLFGEVKDQMTKSDIEEKKNSIKDAIIYQSKNLPSLMNKVPDELLYPSGKKPEEETNASDRAEKAADRAEKAADGEAEDAEESAKEAEESAKKADGAKSKATKKHEKWSKALGGKSQKKDESQESAPGEKSAEAEEKAAEAAEKHADAEGKVADATEQAAESEGQLADAEQQAAEAAEQQADATKDAADAAEEEATNAQQTADANEQAAQSSEEQAAATNEAAGASEQQADAAGQAADNAQRGADAMHDQAGAAQDAVDAGQQAADASQQQADNAQAAKDALQEQADAANDAADAMDDAADAAKRQADARKQAQEEQSKPDLGTEESVEGLKGEADELNRTADAADAAAEAKKKFSEANKDVASGADASSKKIDKENESFKGTSKTSVNSIVSGLNSLANKSQYKNLFIEDAEGTRKLTKSQQEELAMYNDRLKALRDQAARALASTDISDADKTSVAQALADFDTQFASHIDSYIKNKLAGVDKAIEARTTANLRDGNVENSLGDIAVAKRRSLTAKTAISSRDSADMESLRTSIKNAASAENIISNLPKVTEKYAKTADVADLLGKVNDSIAKIKDVPELKGTVDDLTAIKQLLEENKAAANGFGSEFSSIKTNDFQDLLQEYQKYNKQVSESDSPQRKVMEDLKNLRKERSGYFEASARQALAPLNENGNPAIQAFDVSQVDSYNQKLTAIRENVKTISEQWGENSEQAKKATEALDSYEKETGEESLKYLQKRMEATQKSIDAVRKQNAFLGRDETPEAKEIFEQAETAMGQLQKKALSGVKAGSWLTEGFPEAVSDMGKIESMVNTITGRRGAGTMATNAEIDSLLGKVNTDLAKYDIPDEVRSKLVGLQQLLQESRGDADELGDAMSNVSKTKFNELQAQFKSLDGQIQKTSLIGKNFGQELGDAMHTQFTQLAAQYLGIREFIQYGKQMAQTVVELDTSLKELQKVSGEGNDRIAKSFQASSETAKELGSTISDVINSTADWSRLGYNISEAEELARVTTMYQNIAQGIDQSAASEYLVSTLQGFQLQADQAESVIDKINEVAQNFAIDQAGIGEALQRSAASFYTSGTDLSKAIALVTSANSVLQNPEKTGTMWRTKILCEYSAMSI